MRVEVQLFATLAIHLPPGARGDIVSLEVPEGTTIADLFRLLSIPDDVECLRVVNGRDAAFEAGLSEGDVVTLFPPLSGGR